MPAALVTGAAGFAGSHLVDHLRARGVEVVGIARPEDGGWPGSSAPPRLVELDLRQAEGLLPLLRQVRPAAIYHLAAQSNVHLSWQRPQDTLVNNLLAQANLLEAARTWAEEAGEAPGVLVVGSADEYGLVRPEELPVREEQPLRPHSPYAVSKITQDYLGYQYHAAHALPVIRVRPFNHIGPRQGPAFVVSDFARQLARIGAGLVPPVVEVGNLDAERDWTDVRDIVRAYRLALEKGEPGEVYNLGSGRATSVRRLLEMLVELSGLQVEIRQAPSRLRLLEVPRLVADPTRFRELTGWRAEIPLEQTLRETLQWWRERVGEEAGLPPSRAAEEAG